MFQKFVKKIQVSLKSAKIMGTLNEELCTILLRMRNVSYRSWR